MTAPTEPEPIEAEDLQFDQAEYSAPAATAVTCSACHRPIADAYYQANQSVVCGGCREAMLAHFQGGSGFGRFLRAIFYGGLAGLAGAGLHYLVVLITERSYALILILVGIMVGSGVKKGSRQRGGWLYQGLAVFITYTAIVSTYIPMIWTQVMKQLEKEDAAKVAMATPKPGVMSGKVAKAPVGPNQTVPEAAGKKPAAGGKAEPEPGLEEMGLGQVLIALVVFMALLMGVAYAYPFLASFDHPTLLLFIGVGLLQAWMINRKVRLIVNGPFQIGEDAPLPESLPHA